MSQATREDVRVSARTVRAVHRHRRVTSLVILALVAGGALALHIQRPGDGAQSSAVLGTSVRTFPDGVPDNGPGNDLHPGPLIDVELDAANAFVVNDAAQSNNDRAVDSSIGFVDVIAEGSGQVLLSDASEVVKRAPGTDSIHLGGSFSHTSGAGFDAVQRRGRTRGDANESARGRPSGAGAGIAGGGGARGRSNGGGGGAPETSGDGPDPLAVTADAGGNSLPRTGDGGPNAQVDGGGGAGGAPLVGSQGSIPATSPGGSGQNGPGPFTQDAGETILHGGTLESEGGVAFFNGGTLKGSGDVLAGAVFGPDTTIDVGFSPGIINFYDDTEFGGLVEIELAGPLVDGVAPDVSIINTGTVPETTQFDQINVFGTAELLDTLRIEVSLTYAPSANDFFDILTADLFLDDGLEAFDLILPTDFVAEIVTLFDPLRDASAQALRLTYLEPFGDLSGLAQIEPEQPMPAPGTLLLLLTGLVGVALRRRAR